MGWKHIILAHVRLHGRNSFEIFLLPLACSFLHGSQGLERELFKNPFELLFATYPNLRVYQKNRMFSIFLPLIAERTFVWANHPIRD